MTPYGPEFADAEALPLRHKMSVRLHEGGNLKEGMGSRIMKIMHYTDATPHPFDGGAVRGVTGRVAIGRADGAANFCMRVFELSADGHTPLHRHDWEHEIFFHSGRGEVYQDGGWQSVAPGSVAFIPGDEPHQIRNIGAQPLVFVCLIPSGAPEL